MCKCNKTHKSSKIDITKVGVNKLNNLVTGDPDLYSMRFKRSALKEIIDDNFVYTEDQLNELYDTLDNDEE